MSVRAFRVTGMDVDVHGDVDWHGELVEQLDWHWRGLLRPRFEGLGDEEYLWEPVPGCWSVRPDGAGGFTRDDAAPGEPRPEALAQLDEAYERWTKGVRSLDEAGLARRCGQAERLYPDAPLASLILHINRETILPQALAAWGDPQGAEIALLRDLYRARPKGS
jgi:hypothetical protein